MTRDNVLEVIRQERGLRELRGRAKRLSRVARAEIIFEIGACGVDDQQSDPFLNSC